MPTFKAVIAVAVLGVVTACADLTQGPPTDTVLLSDGLVVKGVPGWCAGSTSRSRRGEAEVVVLVSCSALGAQNAASPRNPGLLTVAVDPEKGTAPRIDLLDTYFSTREGAATLAAGGDGAALLDKRRDGEVLYLYARAGQGAWPDALEETYWRALFGVADHFITVSYASLEARPVSKSESLRTLQQQVALLRDVNAR